MSGTFGRGSQLWEAGAYLAESNSPAGFGLPVSCAVEQVRFPGSLFHLRGEASLAGPGLAHGGSSLGSLAGPPHLVAWGGHSVPREVCSQMHPNWLSEALVEVEIWVVQGFLPLPTFTKPWVCLFWVTVVPQEKKGLVLSIINSVSHTTVSSFHALPHLMLPSALPGKYYYYVHFKDGETEAQWLAQVSQLIRNRVRDLYS